MLTSLDLMKFLSSRRIRFPIGRLVNLVVGGGLMLHCGEQLWLPNARALTQLLPLGHMSRRPPLLLPAGRARMRKDYDGVNFRELGRTGAPIKSGRNVLQRTQNPY